MNGACAVVISGLDVTSRQAPADKAGVTASSPAHMAIDDVYHQFVDDMFYEAGDSWSPATAGFKSAARLVPAPSNKGLLENISGLNVIIGLIWFE